MTNVGSGCLMVTIPTYMIDPYDFPELLGIGWCKNIVAVISVDHCAWCAVAVLLCKVYFEHYQLMFSTL